MHNSKIVNHYKNPDYITADSVEYGDLKSPMGMNGIKTLAKKARGKYAETRRNPSYLVFDLNFTFDIYNLTRTLKGTFTGKMNTGTRHIYVVSGQKSIHLTREDLSGKFVDAFRKVRKIKSDA